MNDYFLKILIRQRHEEILAEVRTAQLSKPGHACVIPGNKTLHRLRSFYSKCKSPMAFESIEAVERKIL